MNRKTILKISLLIAFFIVITLLAACKTSSYTLIYSAETGGHIVGEAEQIIDEYSNGTGVTAIPDKGYKFEKWSDGITTPERQDLNVTKDINVAAIFTKLNYSVTYKTDGNGTIQGEADQTVAYRENGTEVEAIPNEGYRFVRWSDGVTVATRTDRNILRNISVTANFEKLTYKVSYVTDRNGFIQGEAIQSVEYGENATTVTAIPFVGYRFVSWSDGVTTAERTDENVQSNITVTSLFEKIYNVDYYIGEGGTIQGEASQILKYGENATTVTAIPDEGYEFVGWSDGVTTAERTDLNIVGNFYVWAKFIKITFKISYTSNDTLLGSIYFITSGTDSVKYGEDGPKLKAIPREDIFGKSYIFIGWSDGVLTAERQDVNITSDIDVVAYFGHSAEYKVNGNIGGRIEGDVSQAILPNEISKEVVAIPDEGFVFAGWSDLSLEFKRQDTIYYDRNIEIFAYFEPIKRTFDYDYGIASGKPTATQITLNRNDIQSAEFIVPTYSGYSFCGWYVDKDYQTKVVNENGRYMYGYAAFSLETDTLYAKWQKEGEEIDTHKILLVFVDEVQTELYSSKLSQNVKVHSKMSALDYALSKLITKTIYSLLNDWFEGSVIFEVDSYFTTLVLSDEFSSGLAANGHVSYNLFARDVSEIFDLLYDYHNILVTASMDDYSYNLHDSSGIATVKEGFIPMEGNWYAYFIRHEPLEECLNEIINSSNYVNLSFTAIDSYIHEFAHTVEENFSNMGYDLHDVERESGPMPSMEVYKLYLLNELTIDGTKKGIPDKYWKNDYDVWARYVVRPIDGHSHGKIVIVGDAESIGKWAIDPEIKYGSEIVVEAIPDNGYRFVKWSDGVTTAIRHDVNIISHINVQAIFEKI